MKSTISKIGLIALFLLGFTLSGFSQAKKPTLMVVPSDVWCNTNGFMLEYDNQGTKVKIPDYKRALQENADLTFVINKIGQLMTDRGFPLKDLMASISSLESDAAEDNLTTNGGGVVESPIDKLRKKAKADIWIKMTWKVNQVGPKQSVTFDMSGIDAYTDKQIAGASGTGNELIGATLAVMLETAVLAHMDNFNAQLQTYFDDLFANGREITLKVKKYESFSGDLETEYGGEELGVQIENWVSANTVKNRFSTTDATEDYMLFEQVRIPLYDEAGKAVDARSWAKGLQKYLKETLQVDCRIEIKGLGQATIYIGTK
jgi:hypothetical protein